MLNRQRQVIYDERRRVLQGEDMEEQIRHFVNDVIEGYVDTATAEGYAGDWDLEQPGPRCAPSTPVSITIDELADEAGGRNSITPEQLEEALTSDAHHAYDAREEGLGAEVMREIERRVVLSVLDRKWREHLYEMDYLQEGIGLRAMAQRDPLVEYQREGFDMFQAMQDSIKREAVAASSTPPSRSSRSRRSAARPGPSSDPAQLGRHRSRAAGHHQQSKLAGGKKVGRNQPCPCGSGKKYKLPRRRRPERKAGDLPGVGPEVSRA